MPETDLKRVDFQTYFLMWNSVLHFPNPMSPVRQKIHGYNGELGTIPCHQHKTCGGMVHATVKYPPRVCPECHRDTQAEHDESEKRIFSSGGVILNG